MYRFVVVGLGLVSVVVYLVVGGAGVGFLVVFESRGQHRLEVHQCGLLSRRGHQHGSSM